MIFKEEKLMEETLKLILSNIEKMNNNITERLDRVENRLDSIELEQKKTNKKIDTLSEDIGSLVTNDIAEGISSQLRDIKTEVEIIKGAVGEHEIDIKYLKKTKIS